MLGFDEDLKKFWLKFWNVSVSVETISTTTSTFPTYDKNAVVVIVTMRVDSVCHVVFHFPGFCTYLHHNPQILMTWYKWMHINKMWTCADSLTPLYSVEYCRPNRWQMVASCQCDMRVSLRRTLTNNRFHHLHQRLTHQQKKSWHWLMPPR